jgi:hypothetical protein
MITMAPNSSREANAAASCRIAHNEYFRMMFARRQRIADADGLFASLGQILNRLLPNSISNYLLTLTDDRTVTSQGARDRLGCGARLTTRTCGDAY